MSDRITADLSGRHPDPARPDLAFRLQTLEIASSTVEHEHEHEHEQVEEHRSPARKKQQQRKREQSSPARLCPPHPQEFEHLSARQKILYSRVKEASIFELRGVQYSTVRKRHLLSTDGMS